MNKNIEPFVFIAPNRTAPKMGAGFVLNCVEPFYLGRITKLNPGPYSIVNYKNEFKPLIFSVVGNYSILIVFAGTLSRYNVRVNGQDWEADLQHIYDEMANWFLEEKINNNQGYYKKYLNL